MESPLDKDGVVPCLYELEALFKSVVGKDSRGGGAVSAVLVCSMCGFPNQRDPYFVVLVLKPHILDNCDSVLRNFGEP